MKAIVTGNAGFIGRHVANHLTNVGWDVTGFDRVAPAPSNYPQIQGDLGDREAVRRAIVGHEVVFHVGAIGDVYHAGRDPSLAAQVNVVGSAHVAEAAIAGGARVVYASTWEVYGEPRYEPIDESHPCEPEHPYSITKLAGERVLLAADHLHGVPVVALRLGTAYGPGLRASSVFSVFINRARRGEPIVVHGDGSQTRQFTHVSDIARAFELAGETRRHGMALNTVSAESHSIKVLVDLVADRYPTEVVFSEGRPGDAPPAIISADRIKHELGWEAVVPFEQGLDELMGIREAS